MTEPTDDEIVALAMDERIKVRTGAGVVRFARAVLARWGTPPAVVGEVASLVQAAQAFVLDPTSLRKKLTLEAQAWGPLASMPQPTQAQAGAVPLTDIRKAALDLYKPPFRHEYGYIRDANHQMVADDAGSEGSGLIASRIRGWGRIKYMDKPEQRAAALQDEVAEIVAEALNTYWAAHGIKGGQHG